MKCRLNWRASVAAVLAIFTVAGASAQDQKAAERKIVDRIAAGADASPLIGQYLQNKPSLGNPRLDRAATLRQLQAAEANLADALKAWKGKGNADAAGAAYREWQAAVMLMQARHRSVEGKLASSADGSSYVAAQRDVAEGMKARRDQMVKLLDPLLGTAPQPAAKAAAKNAPKEAAKDSGKSIAEALALLQSEAPKKAREPVLHALNLPVGGLNLATRAPTLAPTISPAYATLADAPSAPEDVAAAPEGELTREIVAKAKELDNDYVKIYEYVRNNTRTTWYAGAVQGAAGTLRSGSGNDVDQAALLVALLRAAALPTRYVHGVIELPLEKVAQDLGLQDPALVPAALTKAGVAFASVARGGRLAAVNVEHTWVEARVPYTNYRGAVVDASGKTWIPLDPSYKTSSWSTSQLKLADLGGAAALQDAYLAKPASESFAEFVKRSGTELLQGRTGTAADYNAVLGQQTLTSLNLSLLPNSLPYTVVAITSEEAQLGAAYIVKARIKLASGGRTVMATDLPLYQAVNQRVSLTYQPASLEDHRLSLLMGGMDAVPLYLIKLRPQLALSGHVVARASEGLSAGSELQLDVEFTGPFGNQRLSQTLSTGGNQVLVMAGNVITRPEGAEPGDSDSDAMRLMDGVGSSYARSWLQGEDQFAALAGVRALRAAPSLLILTDRFDAVYHGQTPYTMEWKGVTMDALSHPVDAAGSGARDFLQMSGLHGSSLESDLFKHQFAVDAVSADRLLAQAKADNVALLRVDNASLAKLDATSHAPAVKDSVRNLARLGYRIEIPAAPVTVADWTGAGWRAVDPASGASGYFLSGSLHGGATANAPQAWTLPFLAAILAAQNGHAAISDIGAVRQLLKLGGSDGQWGTVGQVLDRPLSVIAVDGDGAPVAGVPVTFSVTAGGGTVGGSQSTVVPTDQSGIASVQLTLGKSTGENPQYVNINPGDKYATRVSQHLVDAVAPNERDNVVIDAPFDATAQPDKLSQLVLYSPEKSSSYPGTWGETALLKTADQYVNPLPGISVSASMDSQIVCQSDQAESYFKPGALFNATTGDGPDKCDPDTPLLGECGKPSINLTSDSDGGVGIGVILSNDREGNNFVTVKAGSISRTMLYQGNKKCGPREVSRNPPTITLGIAGGLLDSDGHQISAAMPGKEYKNPITAVLTRATYPYEVRTNESGAYLYVFPFVKHERISGNVTFEADNGAATTGVSSSGAGTFETRVVVGSAPAMHEVWAKARKIPLEVPYISANMVQFEKTDASIDSPVLPVFSVQPLVSDVTPRNETDGLIGLDNHNHSQQQLSVEFGSAPDSYGSSWSEVDLYENNSWAGTIHGPLVKGKGKALIPRGMNFEPGKIYHAELVLNRGSKVEMRSERFALPTRPRLISSLRASSPTLTVDEINKRACELAGQSSFGFNVPVVATLEIQPLDPSGNPAGSKRTLFSNKSYEAGDFSIGLDAGQIGTGDFLMTLNAVSAIDPGVTDSALSGFTSKFVRSNPLQVGQVLVHGVKVRDGTLTAQPYPVAEPGRGPSLRFQPTYSSGVQRHMGPMGMNWGHNWDSGLEINSCGDVTVSGGDSGNVIFFPDNKGNLVPAKGYHSTLVRDGNDFDFFSKDGSQYHYAFVDAQNQWKLMWVKDSNGNTLTLTYDMLARPAPLLKTVTATDGRILRFNYVDAKLAHPGWNEIRPVISSVTGPGLDMAFKHDPFGNLVKVTGNGRSEEFAYSVDEMGITNRNQMIGYTDPNGRTTKYEYKHYELPLTLPSNGTPFVVPQTVVSKIVTPTGPVQFDYEIGAFSKTTITNQKGAATKYELNSFGSPLKIIDGAGTTTMTWATDDVHMLSKTDPRGVETVYEYDAAGNMVAETVGGKSIKRRYMIQTQRPFIKDKLLEETDRNHHTTTFGRDDRGNLLTTQHPDGGKTSNSYSSNGDLISTNDAMGGMTTFRYDAKGNLKGFTDPTTAETNFALNERGRVIARTNARLKTTAFEVDALDRITSRTDANKGVRKYTYDPVGNKLSEKDEEGNTTTWEYSPHDHPLKETRADGSSKTMEYDPVGNKISETDYRGNTTTFTYDDANRLVTRTEPLNRTTTYGYDGVGHVTSEKDGLNRTTSHTYDALGFRTGTTDAAGGGWVMGRDGVGNLLYTTDPEGRTTSNAYDAMNRLQTVTRPIGTLKYSYDKNGNRVSETDARGNTAKFVYDAANRLITSIDELEQITANEYNEVGNLVKTVDPNLNVTKFEYDAGDRKINSRDGEGKLTEFRYDGVGNLVGQTDPNGNEISHTYDKLNRRIASYDSVGKLGAWDLDGDGNLLSETDANGNSTTHDYNELGQRTTTRQPEGRTLTFETDLMGNRTGLTDGRGNKTSYGYDKLNRVTLSKDAKGGTHVFEYDKVGNKTKETDPLSHSTTTQYDALNRLVLVTDALGQTVKFEYDANGNKVKETDKRGIVTTHTYDKVDRLTSSTRDGQLLLSHEYDRNGNVLVATDANKNATSYSYDRRNLRTSENRLLAAITRFELDNVGDVAKVIDPEGRQTVNAHDARRRLTSVTNALGQTTTYEYDGAGNRTRVVHSLGNATASTYDAANRLKTVSDAAGTHTYGYDKADNHVSYLDALNNETRYEYDVLNRRTGVRYPDGASESFVYDAAGNMGSHTDGNGTVITRTFDAINRETNKHYSASEDGFTDIATGYDANNNVVTVEQKGSSTRTSSYTFDRFDRQITHTDAFGAKVSSTYDANGNKLSTLTQDGQVTRYGYDVLNRLTSVVGKSGVTSYSYDRSSLETRIDYNNGVASVFNYDKAGRVSSVLHQKGGSNLSRTDYEYDSNGNRKKETINRVAGAQVTGYDYDGTDRLTRTVTTSAAKSVATDFGLDAMANRLTETVTTTANGGVPTVTKRTSTYGSRNELKTIDDGSGVVTTLNYDGEGNLTEKKQGSDSTIYRYNGNDNLISVARNGTTLGRYSNDHLGLRIEKEAKDPLQPGAPPVKLRTLWDGRNAFQDRDSGGDVVARYDNDGRHPVGMWHRDDGSQALHRDALGSIVATTDGTGKLKSEIVYDAFGNITEASGQSANKFGYTGHQMDAETGLVYFQARYYDPQLGRFITQDPYEGDWKTPLSLHHYLYAYANPTVYVDLFGYQNTRPNCFSQNPDDCMGAEAKQQRTAHRDVYDREERAKGSKRFRDSVGNNFDEVQRERPASADLTKENSSGAGVDSEEMTPGQRQLKEMHRRGVLAAKTGETVVEALAPDETILLGPAGKVVLGTGGKLLKAGSRLTKLSAEERRAARAIEAEERLAAKGAKGETEHVAVQRQAAEGKPRRIRCSSCFVAGTPVAVQGGFKAIEDVREGDLVLSKSDVTGEIAYKPVVKLIVTQNKGVFNLTLHSATGETEVLTVTNNHPFWVLNKSRFIDDGEAAGWVESRLLESGMLVQSSDGTALEVGALIDQDRTPDTYNLTVADFHTYFVGKARVWVHNVDCFEAPTENGVIWHGSGPVRGIVAINDSTSVNVLRNYKPREMWKGKPAGSIEFVYDPATRTFALGRAPAGTINGSPHEQLAKSIDAFDRKVVGGMFSRGTDGAIHTTENSGHYGRNWTPEIRAQFTKWLNERTGLSVKHHAWE